jgi:hypothetical protein
MAKNRKNKQGKDKRNRTPIGGHERQGNNLLPPFLSGKFPMSPSSWMNDRLPEMIWAALIRVTLGQELGLGIFRRFLNFIGKHASRDLLSDITLTGISRLPADLCDEVISFIVEPPQVVIALQPLHLFEGATSTWRLVATAAAN